jgi:hypothetical protein
MDLEFYTDAQLLWAAVAFFAALAVLAAWRDHARTRRRDVDRPGWVPWTGVTVLAILLALVATVLAVRA